MKKIIVIIFLGITLSGCNETNEEYSCVYENTTKGNEYTTVIEFETEGNEIKASIGTITYKDENVAKNMCEIYKMASDAKGNLECNDKVIIINNYHLSVQKNSKSELLEYLEGRKFTCKSK